LRRDMSTNIRRRLTSAPIWSPDTRADIARLETLWSDLLNRFGGPFLFAKRSIADAMFAPVATRLRTYAVEISPQAQSYCDTISPTPPSATGSGRPRPRPGPSNKRKRFIDDQKALVRRHRHARGVRSNQYRHRR